MKKILIVDDSAFMRNILKEILINNANHFTDEFEIHEADGKTHALTAARKINPDAILLDIVMQESDLEGIETIEGLNEFFDLSKIIMVSSIGHVDILDTCKNLGVKFYIQKPFEQNEVVSTLKKVIV